MSSKKKEESHLPEYFQEDKTLGVHQSLIDAELDAPGILLRDG